MDIGALGGLSSQSFQMMDALKKDKVEEDSFAKTLEKAQQDKNDKELMDACVEFESYFIKMMLSSMRSTIDKSDSFIPESSGEKIFTDMLDDEYAKAAAGNGRGIGLAQALYKQMSRNVVKKEDLPPVE